MIPRKYAIGIPAAFLLVLGALGWYAKAQQDKAKTLQIVATEAEKRESIWKQQAEDADRAAASNEDKVRAHEATIRDLRARLDKAPRVPVPAPPPEQDETLAAGLVQAGLGLDLRVYAPVETKPTNLSYLDAKKVWNWQQAASKVPSLETRLEITTGLVSALGSESSALKDQVGALTVARDAWKNATGAADERAAALAKESAALKKSLTAEKWEKWLLSGGTLVTGYFVGRKLR